MRNKDNSDEWLYEKPIEEQIVEEPILYKKDKYLTKRISVHNTYRGKECFEFHVFPSCTIDDYRILLGWLFFTMQITFKPREDE